ncbi:MAG: hypothetical protein AAFV80_03600, partial [Bacteroidota bacterium]
MNKRIRFWLFATLLGMCGVWSCGPLSTEGVNVDAYRPELAVPLFEASVTINDLIENFQDEGTTVQTDGDGFITLVYDGDSYSIDLAELFTVFPDISFPLPDNEFTFPYELPNNIDIDF